MDNQDYLTDYRLFFDNFYQSFEMDNPLPVHIGKYNVAEFEIVGEVICWCLEYLNIRNCPSSLIAPLCRSVIVELEDVIRRDPESCGYRSKEDDYQTLKLMQVTIKKLNEVCLRYRDNSEVSRLPPPPPVSPSVSVAAVKNSRRTMEDCHIVIHDLHALFGIEGYGVASYYAVFDGHIGSDAALYSCSHIYQYLVESQYYPTNPEAAFKEAFIKTDERFIDKSNKENLKSGTTAVCILIRHDLGKMYVAWLGDSQAILVNGRDYIQLVNPHRPEQIEEKERIEAMGGSVVFWGTWRVNGQLAVSRAIGDVDYKPYVTAEPDVTSYDLSGDEDFLLLACDGLWDVVSEKHAVEEVYKCLELHKGTHTIQKPDRGDRSRVSQSLVQAAKSLGSKDNISVVVAWLDMSTLENGHFVPGSEVDSVDDLLPPVLRSLKPAAQTIAPPAAQRLDEKSEKWLKTLPWSYADALRKPAPKKEEPTPPPAPVREPSPIPPQSKEVENAQQSEETNIKKEEELTQEVASTEPEAQEVTEVVHPTPKGDDSGDVGGEGESGDDSDEEWNYISGKENREPNQHTKQELTREEMESQLNPNAAEFVPGYGTRSPTSDMDIADISRSPKRSEIKNLENVVVPTSKEFLKEISKRPSDLDDLGENETTLNGGDLNNLSTKAVFGDDSVCLNSVIDSSLVQNESLKSTNPFHSSQVPNFVQDHFSVPSVAFKPFGDSKDNEDFGLMGSGEKPDLSPSAPALDVYSSEQTDLVGLTFGDGLNVENIVRSKQDSPLLRESPEPGLHNGQVDHGANSPELEKCSIIKENDNIQDQELPKEEESTLLSPQSHFTSDLPEDVDKQVIAELTTEALMHSDHGPETSVDSESDEDVLLSPKMKEKKIDASEQLETQTIPLEEDPVCSLKGSHDIDVEKTSQLGTELEEEHVLHKDDEDGEEELICSIKHRSSESSNFVSEAPVKDRKLFEDISPMVCPDDVSDFEIVNANGDHFASDLQVDSEVCFEKEAEHAVSDDLSSHPKPVEEIIVKEEVHEDLICPIKESKLLLEALNESEKSAEYSFDKVSIEETGAPQTEITAHESVTEFENILEKHKDNVFDLEEESICYLKKEESQETGMNNEKAVDIEFKMEDTKNNKPDDFLESVEDNLVCPVKKDVNIDDSFKNNVNFLSSFTKEDVDIFNTREDEELVCPTNKEGELGSPVQKDNESVCPMQKEDELVSAFEKEDNLICAIQKEEDVVCDIQKEDNSVCAIQKEDNSVCAIQKEDNSVCAIQKEDDLVCPIQKEDDLVCSIQKEDESICSFKREAELVSPVQREDELVCPIQKEDALGSTVKKEDEFSCSVPKENELVCSNQKEDALVSPVPKEDSIFSLRKEEEFVCSLNKEDDLVCQIKREDLLCTLKKEENMVCSNDKENDLGSPVMNEAEIDFSNKIEDTSLTGKNTDSFNLMQKDEENLFTLEKDVGHKLSNFGNDETGQLEELVCPVRSQEDSISSQMKEKALSELEELISPIREEVVCSLRPSAEIHSNEITKDEKIETEIRLESALEISHKFSEEIQENVEIARDISVKHTKTGDLLPDDNLISSEKISEGSVDNLESSSDKLHQEESIDEMSSSMIDHGEDKSLPEAQSNQLDLVQDLQFEVHEKAEADTESDSGFEIINASEASTIEMEVRIQSEKEAGAIDEKLHLDKNEAEIPERVEVEIPKRVEAEVSERLESEVKPEEPERKLLEPLDTKKVLDEVVANGSMGAADTPATPPATPAPGLQVENKEGLIAAAVAAAGVATAVVAGTAAVAESKVEEKKKPPTPKKAEPLTKTAPTTKPPTSKTISGKPAAPTKAAPSKAPTSTLKSTAKPSSGPTKTAPTTTKPTPASKPSTPTTKVPAKPGSKPSTPTGAKAAPSTALKSKPSAPLKSTTTSSVGPKPTAAKTAPAPAAKTALASAAKKPAPTPAPKPTTTAAKSAVSSSVAARAATKPAPDSKSTVSSTQKSPATKMSPTKPTTPTAPKAPTSSRPPSAKTASPTKPPASSAPAKAPAKPAPIRAPAAKAPAAKTTTAPKPLTAKPAAPAKTAPAAPLNKKPAAPTAIKKPTAPTDKSVKEANNKLASAKTGIKKIEDKKIINKKEEIAENEVPLTQEPVVTTTNGHISLIENGIPSPEIVANAN